MKHYSILLFIFLYGTVFAQPVTTIDLTCEYKINPVGIDIAKPRLSWKISTNNSLKNIIQTAYQIQVVANTNDFSKSSAMVWNSGKIASEQSVHVPFSGKPLTAKTRYYWRVKIWDNQNHETEWSKPAYWETGILDSAQWIAKWIIPDMQRDKSIDNPPVLMRNNFRLKNEIKKARLYITAHGLYEAYCNGKRIGEELFTPGWTSYNKRLQYQIYDVTDLLQKGKNVVGAVIADGWYKGRLGWGKGKRNYYGNQLALLFQLEVEYDNGKTETIISDKDWQCTTGAIRMSSIYDGEVYDARLERTGWNAPDYKAKDWQAVKTMQYPKNILIATAGVPVRKIKELEAKEKIVTPKNELVFDFGQNLVGWVKFNIQGNKGDTITIYHAEVLDKEGNFYTDNLRSAKQKVQFIFKDNKSVTYEPHFTFQGFRYIKITDFKGKLNKDNFKAVAIHSDIQPTGTFTCSNDSINQLQSNIQWGQRGNFLDIPTDCPQRDERMGWTGDAQAFASTACFNFDCGAFYTKWLGDVEADQLENGSIPFVVPDVLGGNGSTGWGDVATILPWTMYLKYRDKRILENQYESMKNWVGFLKELSGNNLLVQKGFHFGDWLFFIHPTKWNNKPGYTDIDFLATAFFAHSVNLLAKSAEVLGKDAEAAHYKKLFDDIKAAFQNEFVTPSGRLSPHSQTAYAIALQFNLLEKKQKKQAIDYLVQNIEKRKYHLSTGFLGTPYLCHVLSEHGRNDIAYKLFLQDSYPSWLYPVTRGATTIWERWDGIKPDSTFQTTQMNSFNHYAYGAIGDWMYSVVAGINEDIQNPGYKHIIFQPKPDTLLTYAKAEFESMYGTIKSSWKTKNNTITVEVTIPPNTKATLHLPLSPKAPVKLGSGTYKYEYAIKQ